MAAVGSKPRANRELLSKAIIEVIRSWPEYPRSIFVETHYGGKSVEEVACSSGKSVSEVQQILNSYERKLHDALKSFRAAQEISDPDDCLCCDLPTSSTL